MLKQIIITGITNMSESFICISGFDREEKKYIRPVLSKGQLTEQFLSDYNDKIELGSILELDFIPPISAASPPHIEDTLFHQFSGKVLDKRNKKQFQEFIVSIADRSVEDIFGYEIELIKGQPVLPQGTGNRSLGTIICRKCNVVIDYSRKARCDFIDQFGNEFRHLPITGRDEWIKKPGNYTNVPVRLSLTRLFQKDKNSEPFYWLQVSGVIAI